jgi:hypothetical protein
VDKVPASPAAIPNSTWLAAAPPNVISAVPPLLIWAIVLGLGTPADQFKGLNQSPVPSTQTVWPSVHEHRPNYEQDSCYNDATEKERGALIRRFFHKGRMDTRAKLLPTDLLCDKTFFRASSRCETVWNPRPSYEAKAALLAATRQWEMI